MIHLGRRDHERRPAKNPGGTSRIPDSYRAGRRHVPVHPPACCANFRYPPLGVIRAMRLVVLRETPPRCQDAPSDRSRQSPPPAHRTRPAESRRGCLPPRAPNQDAARSASAPHKPQWRTAGHSLPGDPVPGPSRSPGACRWHRTLRAQPGCRRGQDPLPQASMFRSQGCHCALGSPGRRSGPVRHPAARPGLR